MENSIAIKDKYYLIYFLFYAFGTFSLVPSNFFPTATDYWMYKFRDPNNETYDSNNRTGLQTKFTSDYSIIANVSTAVFVMVTRLLKFTILKRMTGTLCGAIVMLVVTVVFVEIDTDSWQSGFFVMTLIIGFCLTGFSTVFMVTVFQLVAKFPPGFLASILAGQSICGIFAALAQILTLSIDAGSKTNGLVYFLIGTIFVLMTLMYFLGSLKKSEFFSFYFNEEVQTEIPKITKEAFITILNKVKYDMISIFIVMGSSSMIHPGVTSLVVSMDKGNGNKWNDVYFVPVTTFLFYNLFDYIGKELGRKVGKPNNVIVILAMSICRIAFVPILMLCNAQPHEHLPVVFDKDYAYMIFMIIFAFTNGYLVNLCVVRIPTVTNADERRIAMVLLLVCMLVASGAGSALSGVLVDAL